MPTYFKESKSSLMKALKFFIGGISKVILHGTKSLCRFTKLFGNTKFLSSFKTTDELQENDESIYFFPV